MYKLELHLHTYHNSHCAKEYPRDIARIYKDAGYNGIVCTNHFNRHDINHYVAPWYKFCKDKMDLFLRDYYDLVNECKKEGIDVFLGMEASPDFCTYYKMFPPFGELLIYGLEPELVLEEGMSILGMTGEELFSWCNANGLLLVAAHPFRSPCTLPDCRYIHGAEVANLHPGHNSRNDKAETLCKANNLIPTGGSDFHFRGGEGGGIYCNRAPAVSKDVVDILKGGEYEIIKSRKAGK